jgi:hypothetical protein
LRTAHSTICFIDAAVHADPIANEIGILRKFREKYLFTNPSGGLLKLYYNFSPPMVEFITENPSLKPIVKAGLLPAVIMSTIIVNANPA